MNRIRVILYFNNNTKKNKIMSKYDFVEERVVNHSGVFKFNSDEELQAVLPLLKENDVEFHNEDCDEDLFDVYGGAVETVNDVVRLLVDNGYAVEYTDYDGEEDMDFHCRFTFKVSK